MLNDAYAFKHVLFGHQFHFGLDTSSRSPFDSFCDRCAFCDLAVGCHRSAGDHVQTCPHPDRDKIRDPSAKLTTRYIPSYQRNVRRRIRPLYRLIRDSIAIELAPISLRRLTLGSDDLTFDSANPQLCCLIVIQKLGIGSITTWITDFAPTSEDHWYAVRDPCVISVVLETPRLSRTTWSLLEFVRYLVVLAHMSLRSANTDRSTLETSNALHTDDQLDRFLRQELSGADEQETHAAVEIDNYPFVFAQYDLSTQNLQTAFAQHAASLRLSLCGDRNWRCKSRMLIEDSVIRANTSTRDSIIWLANSEGTVKLCSADLETPVEESWTATLLETDIILTMRYFLQKMNTLMLRLATTKLSPTQLSVLRHRLFLNLDKYCNIDVSHKDTTRKRVEQLKDVFQVPSMYTGVVDRFELLSNKLSSLHSRAMETQQTLLTLVFGFFAAFSVLFRILSEVSGIPSSGWLAPTWVSLAGATVLTMALLSLIAWIRARRE